MRAGDLEAPFHGVRRAVAPAQPETRDAAALARRSNESLVGDCMSFLAGERQPVVISHVTAARLYGMPLPRRLENRPRLDVSAMRTRLILVRAGLPEPVIGYRVYDRDGFFERRSRPRLRRRAGCARLRGRHPPSRPGNVPGGHRAPRMFQDAGWRHIRVTADHLSHPGHLIDRW